MAKTTFVDGNPSLGILGTPVMAEFLNALNNHRHTGRDIDGDGAIDYGETTGSANAYVLTLSPALDAHVPGMPIRFKANFTNTGAATMNINGLGAVALKKNVSDALEAGDITANKIYVGIYDGTNIQVINPYSIPSKELIYNLKPIVNANANKLDIFAKSSGAAPDASNIIGVYIPDGSGNVFRSRSTAYLSGTSQIVMAAAAGYWGITSLASAIRTAYLYAIWDGSGIVWALGGHSRLTNVSTTTTATDQDFLLLENGSTYTRNASHYCICVGKITYEYDTADSPNYTIQSKSYVLWGADPKDQLQRMLVVDEKPSGTHGGTFTSGAWRTRDLNTIRENNIPGASLASNQITLPPGKYYIYASAPAFAFNNHQACLYNVTTSSILLYGTSQHANDTYTVLARSVVMGSITLSATSVLELRHQCSSSYSTSGFGYANSFGCEIYSVIEIIKIGE